MTRTVVIAGVGPGLGESLARKFAAEGCQVALFARSEEYIEDLAAHLSDAGEGIAVQTDLADIEQIREGFEAVRDQFGPVDVLVNHASAASWKGLMDVDVEEFEQAWAVNGRGAFVCSQEAVGDMLEAGGGTVIFTGATSAVRSLGGAIGFTAAKFAARGMAMDMAQEFGPDGIHVAHVVSEAAKPPRAVRAAQPREDIDGQIDTPGVRDRFPDREGETFLDPDEMAETYWHLVEQDTVSTQPFEIHITNGPQNSEFI